MRILVAVLLAAAALWGQTLPPGPVITSVSAFRLNEAPRGPAVTAGLTNIFLQVDGAGFDLGGDIFSPSQVLWISAAGTQVLTPLGVTYTQLVVEIPDDLIASPEVVQIKVRNPESTYTSVGVPFTVNPFPAVRPLPNGTVGVAYGPQNLITGGTGPFTATATNPPLPVQTPVGSAGPPYIGGTPGTAGTFPFTATIMDAWGQGLNNAQYTLTVAPAPAIAPATLPRGTVGVLYSQTVSASGGNTPYTWSVATGTLPPGVNFTNGAFTGTPTTAGTYTVTVRMGEAAGGFATQTFTIAVDNPLLLVTTTLPNGYAGASYTGGQLQATGGLPPYAWSLSGSLPAGLSLNSTAGAITGTPSAAGTSNFTVTVGDSAGRSVSRALSIAVTAFTILTPSPLASAIAGVGYSQTFAATGAPAPYTWAITAGNTPPGLSMSAAGVLSGIPTTPGTYNFTVRASTTTAVAAPVTTTSNFTLVVNPTNLTLSGILPAGWSGEGYSGQLSASGATPPYTFSVISGALPPGLALNSSTGAVSGSPQRAGSFPFTAQVADSSGQSVSLQLTINIQRRVPPLVITTASLPNAVLEAAYGAGIEADGGEPPYTWRIAGLPPGLTAGASGMIAGAPTKIGTYTVTAEVADSGGQTARKSFTLIVEPAPLVITTGSPLPDGEKGQSYSASFAAKGGVLPYVWAASGGSLPPGLALSRAGSLTGTLVAEGVFDFTVQVTDSNQKVATRNFRITVRNEALKITTASPLPKGSVGVPYSAGFAATGGTKPYQWSASGLPAGLSLDGAGNLTGTPTAKGATTFTVQVTDTAGAKDSKAFELTIDPEPLRITTASIADGRVGESYAQSFSAEGGTPPYRWDAVAGWAGPGLSLSSDGALTGAPGEEGKFTVVVQVTDAAQVKATRSFTFNIAAPTLTITTASPLPAGMVGAPYSQGFSAAGNVGAVTWSADAPAGLGMSGATLTGTPTASGTFTFTVRASDAAGRTAQKTFSLTIGLPALPAPSFTGLPDISEPGRQPAFQLGLTGSYPVAITGRLTLTFTPLSGAGDPAVQFSTGGTVIEFTIPAGANLATFPVPNPAIQTGTVAGTITLTATFSAGGQDITPAPPPVRAIRINPAPPVITEVRITRTATGFDVQVTGYATNREVLRGLFRFNASASGGLGTTEQTVTVDSTFNRWYQDAASRPFGSRFTFVQPFTVQGDTAAVASVTVTLSNSVGNSNAMTANVP